MNDGAVVAFEYERECRRYSVERFTSLHRGDTSYIFWTGPQDLFWKPSQALVGRRALVLIYCPCLLTPHRS